MLSQSIRKKGMKFLIKFALSIHEFQDCNLLGTGKCSLRGMKNLYGQKKK